MDIVGNKKLIEISNLTLEIFFKNENGIKTSKKLFNNLNFVLNKGEKLVFIDENGTGKSLLLNLIYSGLNNNLIRCGEGINISSGTIIYKERNILIPDQNERRPFVIITQEDAIRTNATILSTIYDSCAANGIDYNSEYFQEKISYYLKCFNLYEKRNTIIGEHLFSFFFKNKNNSALSFGEKKIVNIISKLIIAEKCELLLIDEPLNHLSFKNSKIFNKLMCELVCSNPDLSIIVISHCKGINFVNEKIHFSKDKNEIIKEKFVSHNCFN